MVVMVSWDDGDSSESSTMQYISSYDSHVPIPATIDDPNHSGADDKVMCEHGKSGKKTLKFCFADFKKEKEKLCFEKSNLDCIIAQLMKDNHMLVSDNNTLECSIVDMKKVGENHKRKLKEIRGICDEE
ncbi:putative kinesin heavy chain isoform [Hordeum vulgare]|nr:putative kinesin heavy chain isoform [Hordeum vulgare]